MTPGDLRARFERLPVASLPTTGEQVWYHGGAPGRSVGDYLMPSGLTGNLPWSSRRVECAVYITLQREYALLYAARFPDRVGVIYVVQPETPIKLDPEIAGLMRSFPSLSSTVAQKAHCCWRARVSCVIGAVWHAPRGAWWNGEPAFAIYQQNIREWEEWKLKMGWR